MKEKGRNPGSENIKEDKRKPEEDVDEGKKKTIKKVKIQRKEKENQKRM